MSESQIINIESKEQLESVLKKAKAVFLDYSTSWCGPCKRLGADLHTWIDKENKYKNVTIVKVMVDDEKLESLGEDIKSVPTIHFYKHGKRVDFPYEEEGKCHRYDHIAGYDKKKIEACLEWLNS